MATSFSQITQRIGFVGREDILRRMDDVVSGKDPKIALFVEGGGGIGKTRLLTEVYRRYAPADHLGVVNVVDFDDSYLQISGNLEQHIAKSLGTEHFKEYFERVKRLRQAEQAGMSEEFLEQDEDAMRAAFLKNLNFYAQFRRVVLLLDTCEKLKNAQVWENIFNLMENAENTVFFIAGREDEKTSETHQRFLEAQSRLSADSVGVETLQPLKPEESLWYLKEKQKEKRVSLSEPVVKGLLTLSQGRPILLDLAIEWIARDIPQDWILEIAEKQLSTSDLNSRRFEFEKLLVSPITQIRTRMDQLCLLLSRVYPLDSEGIARLLRISQKEARHLREEAVTYVFIKQLPNDQISLHDDMRRMIHEHVWGIIDPLKERRIRQSATAKEYLKSKIEEAGKGAGEPQAAEAKPASLSIMEYALEQERRVLRGMYLFHALYANFEEGVKEFTRLFDEDSSNNSREILIDQIESREFEERAAKLERLEVLSRKAEFLKRKGELSQALQLVKKCLSIASDDDAKLDFLIKAASVEVNLGRASEAVKNLKEAQRLCETNEALKKWQANVFNLLGFASRMQGKLSEASTYYRKALNALLASKHSAETLKAAILNNLGYVTAQEGRYRSALGYCQQAFEIRQGINDRIDIGSSFSAMGEVYRNWGKYSEALRNYEEALKIFEAEEAQTWLARVYSFRGAVYRLMGELDLAEKDLQKSIEFRVRAEQPWAYHVLGCVYWNRGELSQALQLFEKSGRLAKDIYDIRTEINNLVGSAEVYYQQWANSEKTDKSFLDKINASWDELQKIIAAGYDFPHHFGRMQRVLADVAFDLGDYDRAVKIYAEAYAALGKRAGGYGKRKFSDELAWLGQRMDAMAEKDVKKTIDSCNFLMEYWSDDSRPINRRDELISFCDIKLIKYS